MTQEFHLAQINIGKMIGTTIDDPVMKDFVDQLDEVNSLSEKSKGFVWRLKDENDNATNIKAFDDAQIIVNMSVWQTVEDLETFVYGGQHLQVLKRRKEWFSRLKMFLALWWIPAGTIPTVEDAKARLLHLEQHGPSAFAFDFKKRYAPPQKEWLPGNRVFNFTCINRSLKKIVCLLLYTHRL